MQNQIISAFFYAPLPSGLYYELSDDTGVQSAGPVVANSTSIDMNVNVDPLVEIEYDLILKDSDGVIQNCKFSHSVGGIVIVENVDIDTKDPIVRPKFYANQMQDKRKFTSLS